MKESKLRSLIREEILKEISSQAEQRLDRIKEIRKKVSRFHMDLSDQQFEGAFTRGDYQKIERNFKEIKERLENIERIILEEG